MLNKSLCIKCINNYKTTVDNSSIGWDEDVMFIEIIENDSIKETFEKDETSWNKYGLINCMKNDNKQLSINGKPPKDCPYYLEHILKDE